MYFTASGILTDAAKIANATLLMTDDAALWLRVKFPHPTNLHSETWTTFKTQLLDTFRPKDYNRRARDQLAHCTQTGNVMGYAAAFQRALLGCTDVSPAEALDRFVRGLRKDIQAEVIFREPVDLEDAVVIAEKAQTAGKGKFAMGQYSGHRSQRQPPWDSGLTPMELGQMSGGHGRRSAPNYNEKG